MNENILIRKKENINLSKTVNLNDFLDIQKIKSHDFSKKIHINGFIVTQKDGVYFCKKSVFFKKEKIIKIISYISKKEELQYILIKHMDDINVLNSDKSKFSSSLDRIISYIYLDVFLLVEIASYKHNNNINYSKERELIYNITNLDLKYSKKIEKENSKKYSRSNIANRAKNTVFFSKNTCSKNISPEIKRECISIGLNEIELPINHNKLETIKLLKIFNSVLKEIGLKNRKFTLRFKKIAHYRKTGLYIKNAQTIIVDPRNVSTLFHELGHFIYENKCSIKIKGLVVNANNIDSIVVEKEKIYEYQIKNHKIEELNKNSEIFAYYFEDLIIGNINKNINKNNALLQY